MEISNTTNMNHGVTTGQVMRESKDTKVNKVNILLLRSEDTSNHSNTQAQCWVDQKVHPGFSAAAYGKCERTYWPTQYNSNNQRGRGRLRRENDFLGREPEN